MYEAYWQLDRRPFENTSDPRFYYPGESHQGAMLKLRYAVENRRPAALLSGASGSGKTLLVSQLQRYLGKQCQPFVHLVFPQMPTESLLAYLADELVASGESSGNRVEQTVRRIQKFLTQNAAQDQHTVIAIDEAHLLDSSRTWEALRLLMNFDANAAAAVHAPVGWAAWAAHANRSSAGAGRTSGREVSAAAVHRRRNRSLRQLSLASGRRKDPIFQAQTMETLHELTHGLPRKINRLCDLALLVGYAEERKSIGPDQLEAVAEELVTVTPE